MPAPDPVDSSGNGEVVLDRDVAFMDSSGLRCLWSVRERMRSHGGNVVPRSPSPSVLRVLGAMELVGEFVVEAG